jgi:hypothetical protein
MTPDRMAGRWFCGGNGIPQSAARTAPFDKGVFWFLRANNAGQLVESWPAACTPNTGADFLAANFICQKKIATLQNPGVPFAARRDFV